MGGSDEPALPVQGLVLPSNSRDGVTSGVSGSAPWRDACLTHTHARAHLSSASQQALCITSHLSRYLVPELRGQGPQGHWGLPDDASRVRICENDVSFPGMCSPQKDNVISSKPFSGSGPKGMIFHLVLLWPGPGGPRGWSSYRNQYKPKPGDISLLRHFFPDSRHLPEYRRDASG